MTEQFPMHNYSAHSFCHLERSVSGVERSRHSRTFILAKHPRCSQPTKDETFECSPSPGVAADCRRKAPNRPDTTLSGAEGGAKGSTPRNIHRCSSKRFTPARPSRRSELLPSRFAWVHAHPTVEIPRFRFATLGMTEQCTIHNYFALLSVIPSAAEESRRSPRRLRSRVAHDRRRQSATAGGMSRQGECRAMSGPFDFAPAT